jgi:hypothetical protein
MTSPSRYTRFCQIHDTARTLAVVHDLTLALSDLDHCDPLFVNAAKRMQDARAGLPGAQAYDSPSVSGGGSASSAPERLAEQTDATQADRDLLDRILTDLWTDVRGVILEPAQVCTRITRNTLTLRRLVDAWTPHRPTDKQRAQVAAVNDGDWCTHHQTAGYMEPTHRHWLVDGVKVPLCQACIDQHRRNGRLPSGEWMQRRASRGKPDRVQA